MSAQIVPLVTPAELPKWGASPAFLAQFEPRPIDVKIETGGALGVMEFSWKWATDSVYEPTPIVSDSGLSFFHDLTKAFAELTWSALTYVEGTVFRVDRNGVVSGGIGLTATRYDQRIRGCTGVTAEAMTLMEGAVRAPLVTWSDDLRIHATAMVRAFLLRCVGASAQGDGDTHVFLAEDAARQFFRDIGRRGKPAGIVDTSPDVDGPMRRYPRSKPLRGWNS